MTPSATTSEALTTLAAQARQDCGSEALAWGVVLDGRLAMSGGIGATARTVFRIASMTKSFTAATILALRDAGELRLDDEVPLLAGVRATADSPPITYRHLLTMSSGLPEDDAWADRHMDWSAADVERLVAGGLRFAYPTGTAFEYSNLGYVLLGDRSAARPPAPRTARADPHDLDTSPSTTTGRGRRQASRSSATARSPAWAASGRASRTWPAGSPGSTTRSRPGTIRRPRRRPAVACLAAGDATDPPHERA